MFRVVFKSLFQVNTDICEMTLMKTKQKTLAKTLPFISALFVVAACSGDAPSLSGEWPSTHVPQSYEGVRSQAASTSPLGGVALNTVSSALGSSTSIVAMSGSLTHNTKRTELNDGTYVFVDADGPNATHRLADAAGVTGSIYLNTQFQYVSNFSTYRPLAAGESVFNSGYVGMVTASTDIPSAGGAAYRGESFLSYIPNTGSGISYRNGTSAITVDFATGTADIVLGNYDYFTRGPGSTPLATAPFDEIVGVGIVLNGARLSGGTWQTLDSGATVSVVGTNQTALSSGAFYGYDTRISAPDEVAGVLLLGGTSAVVTGSFVAD